MFRKSRDPHARHYKTCELRMIDSEKPTNGKINHPLNNRRGATWDQQMGGWMGGDGDEVVGGAVGWWGD